MKITDRVKENIKADIQRAEDALKYWRGVYDVTENNPHVQSNAGFMIGETARKLERLKQELAYWSTK